MARGRNRWFSTRGALIIGIVVLIVFRFALTVDRDAVAIVNQISLYKPHTKVRGSAGSHMSKVALLFLTRGPMPLEPIWRRFLESAGDWEKLFLVLVHAPSGYKYSEESIFYQREISNPVPDVQWGQHSVMEAERRLLAAGLEVEGSTEAASHFVLLSETTIPLYHPVIIYMSIVKDVKSRVNACMNSSDPGDGQKRMVFRLQEGMQQAGVTTETWRKSAQWFLLIRRHAELIARETEINAVFEKECFVKHSESGQRGFYRFCVSDEHYIPTVLAVRHLESECVCDGEATRVIWRGNTFHPVQFNERDAMREVLDNSLRSRAACPQAVQLEEFLKRPRDSNSSMAEIALKLVDELEDGDNFTVLPATCPLFARKIDPSAASAERWLQLLSDDVLLE